MPVSVDKSPFDRASSTATSNTAKKPDNAPKNGEWIETFLTAVMTGMSVTDAAAASGIHITLPYKTRNVDEVFRRAWVEAVEIGTEAMEQEAARRAYHGVLKPVFQKGIEVGRVREYSDTLMIFLLKARNPAKYREGIGDDGAARGMTLNINVLAVDARPEVVEVRAVGEDVGQDREGVAEAGAVPPE